MLFHHLPPPLLRQPLSLCTTPHPPITSIAIANPFPTPPQLPRRHPSPGGSPFSPLRASLASDAMIASPIVASALSGLLAASVAAFVAAGWSLAFQPLRVVRWMQKMVPNVFFLKHTKELVVALTIDDGPHKGITAEILDVLKENNSHATWFIIGSNMDACPDMVARIHAEGHEVGNHTMYDVPSWRLSTKDFEKQLLDVDGRLNEYYFTDEDGRPIKWFRPGHGFFRKQMLQITETYKYRTALGSLFPLDTLFTNQGRRIAKYLLWRIHPGAIIILHDREPQKKQTAEALRILLPELKRKNYSVVSLSELFELKRSS